MSLDDAGAVREGESGDDRVEVLAQEPGEAADRCRCVLLGLADPLQQQVAVSMTDELVEDAGEVMAIDVLPDRTSVGRWR